MKKRIQFVRYNLTGICAFAAASLPFSMPAFAGGGESGGHAEGGAAGFPQLDSSTYASQVFWLFVTFAATYFIMSRVALPRIAHVLELREAKKRSDLTEAERVNDEAETVFEAYKNTMREAQDDARQILGRAAQDIAEMQAQQSAAFQEEMQERLKKSETAIRKAVDQAMDGIAQQASDLTQNAAAKIAKMKVANTDTAGSVKDALRKTGEA